MTREERRFWAFHQRNPIIYRLFCRFCSDIQARGLRQYSAYAIMHRIRWYTHVETTDHDFKINNNFIPWYARLWMQRHPQEAALLRVRATMGEKARA